MSTDGYSGGNASSDAQTQTAPDQRADYTAAVFNQRYRIEKELGRGNIGVVYLAKDQQLHERPVVIKVLLDTSSGNQWFRKKFRQEIEALAKLDHPGIVGAVDLGETPDGKAFIAMQYIKGKSLRSKIEANGMDFDDVATIIRQAGQALSAAHAEGIIHCDLKPENIMLQDLGEGEFQTKIVDFGIAKVKNSQVAPSSAGTSVAGTPPYMSPEQIEGHPSAATDIFALGVIAYEMLTGRRPFTPPTQYLIRETIREGVRLKPKMLRPELPEAAEEIILKALSYESEDRYNRARDFSELLAQALTTDLEIGRETQKSAEQDLELAHVLFMDLVDYSKLPTDRQTQLVNQLQQIVSSTEAYQKAKATSLLISRSTGDGMALAFFSGPRQAVQCAVEVALKLQAYPHIPLRMGVNSGPVYRTKDMNGAPDVAGSGINMAQRVMDSGDAGHILLSKSTADVLKELGDWRDHIYELGEHKVKHGVSIHLYNLYVNEAGNSRIPEKLSKKRTYSIAITGGAILLIVVVALAAVLMLRKPTGTEVGAGNTDKHAVANETQPSTEPPLSLSYSLTVQKFQGNKMDGPEFQLADSNIIFNPKYQIKLNVTTPQPGYFYVLNEAAEGSRDAPIYIMLYPSDADKDKGASTRIVIPEPADEWIEFDNNRGTEKLWLVWSESTIPELEAVKALANQENGEVRDQAQAKSIQGLLLKYLVPNSHKDVDNDAKHTTVKGKGGVVAYSLNLEHQP